jgi:hypothetical protein
MRQHFVTTFLRQAEIGSIGPLGRAIFLMIPGTSCLATIALSLRDKNRPPIGAPRIILALMEFTSGSTLGLIYDSRTEMNQRSMVRMNTGWRPMLVRR